MKIAFGKSKAMIVAALGLFAGVVGAPAGTIAYFTFENGTAGQTTAVVRDSSVESNNLNFAWVYAYSADVLEHTVCGNLSGRFTAGSNHSAGANLTSNQCVNNNFTLELWYKGDGGPTEGFVGVGNTAAPATGYGLTAYSGVIGLYFPGIGIYSSTAQFPSNVWSHFALERDNGTYKIFLNRKQIYTNSTIAHLPISPADAGKQFTLRLWAGTNDHYYDSVRFSNTVLSPDEFLIVPRGTVVKVK